MEVEQSQETQTQAKNALVRVPGRSLFPVARVQKIIKADKELDGIAKEAVFLVSLATEKFIARLIEGAKSQAGREKRATVQRKDILTITRREEEYFFLGDILEDKASNKLAFTKKAEGSSKDQPSEETQGTLLQAFGKPTKKTTANEGTGETQEEDALEETGDLEDLETQDADEDEGMDARSEALSLPPSSRPPSPLSTFTGEDSEPVDFEPDDEEDD